MGMHTEDAIYLVEMCWCTGVACIRCNPDHCEHRRMEKRHHPWQGQVDVDTKDVGKVPEEDLKGLDGGAEASISTRDSLIGITGRFL